MAPKKPAVKPAKQVAKPVLQKVAKPAPKAAITPASKSNLTVWPAAEAHAHHHHGACCDHSSESKGLTASLTGYCPIAGVLCTRTYWASAVVAFFVIFATDWLLHSRFLVADYAATSGLWRADREIEHEFIFATQILTAMAYSAIILAIGHASRWWGAFSSGLLAASVAAIAAFTSYVMLPFASSYIPTVWAIASLIQGGLVGLAVCATLRLSRAPEGDACCSHGHHIH
ncbi:MAG: hypothetical protein EON60_01730 [Alphaproteobacteria bacterium]|nr:MAG: hypothetical protein EON60_01730 [Alphaproteobacteria bacterium]